MLIQLQKSLVDSIRQLASLDKQQTPTSDLIGMIIGLVLGIILLIVFFIYLAYFFPWWLCYNKLCVKCFNLIYYIDCVLCYYTCPCMENKAHKYQIEQNKKNRNKCFVQDLLTTPDGCTYIFLIL